LLFFGDVTEFTLAMRCLTALLSLGAVVLIGSATIARAQSYSINWYTIAGGGGTSTNGGYSLSGTIGQAAAGTLSGGNYSLTGGFWGIIAAVQTPGAPTLTIATASGNHVVISWPAPSTGYFLQSDPTLGNTNWVAVNTNTYPVVVTNGINAVTLPVSGNQYFRLILP
jgi:hypothetical protein